MNKSQHNALSVHQQLELARAGAAGDKSARQQINTLTQPLIDYHTCRFCKRFCSENQYLYRCTLTPPMGSLRQDATWCEWGNASYGWMLDDLSSEKRLLKYQGTNGASLFDYLYQIANSLPFYERWKDWRFGRRVHVPTYIKSLSPHAAAVFLGLRSGGQIQSIAQKLSLSVDELEPLVHSMICLLTKKNRLHLLNPPSTVSMTEYADDNEIETPLKQLDIASYDKPIEETEDQQRLSQAWSKLEPVEQFVLEALLIEEQDAEDVLAALITMNLSIKNGIPPEQANRQQLYYFRRKSLEKLATLLGRQ